MCAHKKYFFLFEIKILRLKITNSFAKKQRMHTKANSLYGVNMRTYNWDFFKKNGKKSRKKEEKGE
jgi:hypothetical protein